MTGSDPALFDPDVELPPAEGRLATLVARLPRARIQVIEYEGHSYWVKQSIPTPVFDWRSRAREWLVRRTWPGMRWLPRVEWGSGPLLREARRLVSLRAGGISVPEVLAASSHWMVLADTGTSMRELLKTLGPRNRTWMLARAATELAEFHAAGFWHGGAQVKNITVRKGKHARIDFDDSFDPALTLGDLQARDLFFYLLSSVDWVTRRTLDKLVRTYMESGGPESSVAIARAEMEAVCDWFGVRRLPGGDLRRVLGASAVLRDAKTA